MSFRSANTEASLRLYSLPRRELQALCKHYGIPANKTNVKMADALSACIPVESAKTKACAGTSSLGLSKTTPMKVKLERKTALPEASLASLILNGKRKMSPMKVGEKPTFVADMEEASSPKPNTTPLKRGIKRTERPMQSLHEKSVAALPAFTRAAGLHDWKSVSAASSPTPGAPNPRKRKAEKAAIVTRRGGDALLPVSFSDLMLAPKKSELHIPEIIQLNSTGKTEKKKSRLGARASGQNEETTFPLPRTSRGKRVAFVDELELESGWSRESHPASDQGIEPEPESATIVVSFAEIEFKNTPLHRELLGVRRISTMDENQDVVSAPREAEHEEHVSESLVEVGFEFRDMALHKELLSSESQIMNQEHSHSPHDLQQAETSANATDSEALELGTPFASSPEVPDNRSMAFVLEDTGLCTVREDASDGSNRKVKELSEHTENNLAEGRDLRSVMDDMACDDLAEGHCEKGMEVLDVGDVYSPACSLHELRSDAILPWEHESSAVSPRPDVEPVIQEEEMLLRDPDCHSVDALVNGMVKNTIATDSFQVTHASSAPRLYEQQAVDSCATPKSAKVRRSPLGLVDKEETNASPSVASAERVVASASNLVMPGPSAAFIPVTPSRKTQSSADSPLAMAVTPLSKIQSNIDFTLAKATSILEKLAAWRADAEKKTREGHWEPKFTTVVKSSSPAAVFRTPVANPAVMADKDLPSSKKARPAPTFILDLEDSVVCEDGDIVPKGGVLSGVYKFCVSDNSRVSLEVSDKENQSEKYMGDKNSRKFGCAGKENKKGKKFEVLKDRPQNVSDHAYAEIALGSIKPGNGQVRLEDMSLRKLRAQVKEKEVFTSKQLALSYQVNQLESSKLSGPNTQRSWN